MQLFAIIYLCSVFSLSVGASNIQSCGKRIVQHQLRDANEHSTLEGDWPWNAAIYHLFHDTSTFKCAGTLIHSSTVLTSARCVFEEGRQVTARRIEVYLGKLSLKQAGANDQKYQVHEIIVHPAFNASKFENNIAIIRLSTEATLNDYVQPVCLWNSDRTEAAEVMDKLGTVIGWGIRQSATEDIPETPQKVIMSMTTKVNCLYANAETFLPEGSFCAAYRDGTTSGVADSGASMTFEENDVYSIRGIMSKVGPVYGHNNNYAIFIDVAEFIPWIQEVEPAFNRSQIANVSVCRLNEEFVIDPYRCDETCEGYGNPICMEYAPEGKCYCKKGFIRLKLMDICVAADNRACRAKMPPAEETCAQLQNERLSDWLYDEPCANTCENYNVPCNVSVPAGMFWGPHCVCKSGFARLPNRKCVAIDDPKCKGFWDPVPSTTIPTPTVTTSTLAPTTTPRPKVCTDFCGRFTGMKHVCPQFDLEMQWSSAGAISGKYCTQLIEVADPHTWTDNFICFNGEYGVRWSSAGAIGGMECTQIVETADPHTWLDNYLCVPHGSSFRFRWSSNGAISGLCCTHMFEPADPHTWHDNYLCVSE